MSELGQCKRCGAVVAPACGDQLLPPALWSGTRLTVTLANGSQMDLTVCDECAGVAVEDEDGFLGEMEEIVVKLWRDEGGPWLGQYFKRGTPFMAVSHVVPWSVAGRER